VSAFMALISTQSPFPAISPYPNEDKLIAEVKQKLEAASEWTLIDMYFGNDLLYGIVYSIVYIVLQKLHR
jgi:hypothetical protein